MPVALSFRAPQTFLIEASGTVTYDEVTHVVETLLSDPRLADGADAITDARKVTGVLSASELRLVAGRAKELRRAGLRANAIVTPDGFVYGVARMFSALAELVGARAGVFKTLDEAEAWIAGGAGAE